MLVLSLGLCERHLRNLQISSDCVELYLHVEVRLASPVHWAVTHQLIDAKRNRWEQVLLTNSCLEMHAVLFRHVFALFSLLQNTVDCDQLPLQGRGLGL